MLAEAGGREMEEDWSVPLQSLFANISTPSALKTSHVCSFMRAVAPCHPPQKMLVFEGGPVNTNPSSSKAHHRLPRKRARSFSRLDALCLHHHQHPRRLARTLVSEGGSSLLPPPPTLQNEHVCSFSRVIALLPPPLLPQLYFLMCMIVLINLYYIVQRRMRT